MAKLRQDRLRQRWIIISDQHEKRDPLDFEKSDSHRGGLNPGPCAFCSGFEHETGREIFTMRDSDQDDWHVRVTVNKFPAVSTEFDELPEVDGSMESMDTRVPAFGSHEVVIETPNHELSLPELPDSHIAQVPPSKSILMIQSFLSTKFCSF